MKNAFKYLRRITQPRNKTQRINVRESQVLLATELKCGCEHEGEVPRCFVEQKDGTTKWMCMKCVAELIEANKLGRCKWPECPIYFIKGKGKKLCQFHSRNSNKFCYYCKKKNPTVVTLGTHTYKTRKCCEGCRKTCKYKPNKKGCGKPIYHRSEKKYCLQHHHRELKSQPAFKRRYCVYKSNGIECWRYKWKTADYCKHHLIKWRIANNYKSKMKTSGNPNHKWNKTNDDNKCARMFVSPCVLCKREPFGKDWDLSQLDRIDNNQNYKMNNMAQLCNHCNKGKLEFTVSEFISTCFNVTENLKQRLFDEGKLFEAHPDTGVRWRADVSVEDLLRWREELLVDDESDGPVDSKANDPANDLVILDTDDLSQPESSNKQN